MKCSLGISNFLEETSSLSHSVVSLYFFASITEEGFLIFPCYSLELYSPWNSPGQNIGVGNLSLLQRIFPTQGLNPGLPHCKADSLPAEPQEKSKNTGVGSLSLLQGIFPTQASNWYLLHCRQILYHLSYQGHVRRQRLFGSSLKPSLASE